GVALRLGVVVAVAREAHEDVSHDDVRRAYVLDDAAAAAPGLDADAPFGAGEDAVRDDHVAHVPARLAPDDDPAVTVRHGAVRDRDVLARPALVRVLGLDAGL